jgi:hypothetical protein
MLKQPLSNILRLANIHPVGSAAFNPVDIESHNLRGGAHVRSRRTRGPQQLITEPVPFVLGQSWDDLAGNEPAQITTSLPALEILKAADRPRFNSFHLASLPLSPTRRHYYLINE